MIPQPRLIAAFAFLLLTLSSPLAAQAAPKVYVSYRNNSGVAVYTPSGVSYAYASTVAGYPTNGYPFPITASPDGTRVYVGDIGLGAVYAIDTSSDAVVATYGNMSGPMQIAVGPTGLVYVANAYGARGLRIINPTTGAITAGPGGVAGGIALHPTLARLYMSDSNALTLRAIDTSSLAVTGTLQLPGRGGAVAITPDGSKVYVQLYSGSVAIVDTRTFSVTATVFAGPMDGGQSSSIVASHDGAHVYVANDAGSFVSVIDTRTNAVQQISGLNKPWGIGESADGSTIFGANYFGGLSVVSEATNTVTATIATPPGNVTGVVQIDRLPNGAACKSDGSCGSGFCVDGVCCNTACNDGCNACATALGATTNGTCTALPAGSLTGACYPYECGGASACPTGCSASSDCAMPNLWCSSNQCIGDVIPPTVTLDALPTITRSTVLNVSGTAIDAQTSVVSASLVVDGVPMSLSLSAGGSFRVPVPMSGEGTHTVTVQARDVAGNVAATQTAFIVDTTAPQLAIVSPQPNTEIGTASIDLTAIASDANPSQVVLVNGETTAWTNGQANATVPALVTGNDTITVTATDLAGNSTTATVTVLVDLSAPVVTSSVASGARYAKLPNDMLPWTVTVQTLLSSTTSFSYGGKLALPEGGGALSSSAPLQPGPNTFTAFVTDSSGRISADTETVIYDIAPPSGAFTSPAAGAAVRGTIDLGASAVDDFTGVASVRFTVDAQQDIPATASGGNWVAALDASLLPDGPHHVVAHLVDGVGNARTIDQTIIVDNTPPAVAITAPKANAYVTGTVNVTASASDATTSVAQVRVRVNGNLVGTCSSSPCTLPFATASLADGPFSIVAEAVDAAGNQATSNSSAISVNSQPASFLTSPLNGSTVGKSFIVSASVSNSAYVDYVLCAVDGKTIGQQQGGTFAPTSVSTLDMLDGSTTVTCSAVDMAGNVTTNTSTVNVKNWTMKVDPSTLNLKSNGGSATVYVEGANVSVLLPIASRDLALVPQGSGAVSADAAFPGSATVGDANHNGIPDVTLKFDRQGLVSSIKGGIDAATIDASKPLNVTLISGSRKIGSDTIRITR